MPNIRKDRFYSHPRQSRLLLHSSPPTPPKHTGSPAYHRRLDSGVVIAHTTAAHAEALEALQHVIFPSLDDAQRFKAQHYLKHLQLFPEGQFVALREDQIVGATSTIRRHFDFGHADHDFNAIIQGGWLTSHESDGDWLYGADLGVDPAFRGRGIARALYAARQQLVWTLGLRGQLAAGMLSGYGARQHEMSAEAYLEALRAGTINDPTLSMQQRMGFELRQLLADHVQDPLCANYSVLIVLDAATEIPGAVRPTHDTRSTR